MKRFFVFKWILIINCYLLIINCLSSCSGKINIVENPDGTKTVSGNLGFSKAMVDELAGILGMFGDETVVDAIKSSNGYNFSVVMPKDFDVTAEKISSLYETLEEEEKMYADLLMAPIFTGEKMAVDEYESLLASVYGATLAHEIVSGTIEIKRKTGTTTVTAGKFLCGIK